MIKLKIKRLDRKTDERGWLSELLRREDVSGSTFGQLIVTTANPGFTKGKHYHLRKREWYIVLVGNAKLLIRNRQTDEIKEKILDGDKLELVEIPVGYYHEITNIGKKVMYLLTYTDEVFNPKDSDTFYE